MTDKEKAEEKAEEYLKDTPPCNYSMIKSAYLDGLAEGRKEKCLEQNNDGTIRPCEVMKENDQLKIDMEIADSQRQLAEKENKELKAQIEKMKNCENYKWNFVIGDYEPCNICSDEEDKWELAE